MLELSEHDLRPAGPEDALDISVFLTTAFEQPDEARLVSALRRDGELALELIYLNAGRIEGYVALARHPAPEGWWQLALIGVSTLRRNRGIGSEMVRHGIGHARMEQAKAVTVQGDIAFFQRFGFSHAAARGLSTPFGTDHLSLYPIAPGTAGAQLALSYPAAFGRPG